MPTIINDCHKCGNAPHFDTGHEIFSIWCCGVFVNEDFVDSVLVWNAYTNIESGNSKNQIDMLQRCRDCSGTPTLQIVKNSNHLEAFANIQVFVVCETCSKNSGKKRKENILFWKLKK